MSLNLTTRQNEEPVIQKLAAQRELYTRAKNVHTAEFLFAGILPFLVAVVESTVPDSTTWFALISCAVSWAIFLFIRPYRKSLCAKAAAIQELIDTDLLRIPVNEQLGLRMVKREEILALADKNLAKNGAAELRSWYPEVADKLPDALGCAICQRSNLSWDGDLRRRYARICWSVLTVLALLWFAIGLIANLDFRIAVFNGFLPLSPLMYLLVQQALSHTRTAQTKEGLIREIEAIWLLALSNPAAHELQSRARALQDEICVLRSNSEPIWKWLYKTTRNTKEHIMQKTAKELVDEALTQQHS